MTRNAFLGPVTWIELYFDGGSAVDGDLRPWMATTHLETTNGVYGMALFELWADTPQQVIDDLLSVLDEHSFTIAPDLKLWVQDRSFPVGHYETVVAAIAQQHGWSYVTPAPGAEAEGDIQ